MRLTEILVDRSAAALFAEIDRILKSDPKKEAAGFLTQMNCYSSKRGLHLRRTLKLDPVAELFIYDLIYKERRSFTPSAKPDRRRFGYLFSGGRPIPATRSYAEFREEARNAAATFKYHVCFDIASYFNSVYHHDLVFWFDEGRAAETVRNFGRYFREIVGGRSVDCLPQGLHPCKMIGANFLKGIDAYHRVRSALMLRFMDDIFLFDDERAILEEDFLHIQRYLGDRGFSLNAEKTVWGEGPLSAKATIDDVKVELLEMRREALEAEYGDLVMEHPEEEAEETEPLTEEQVEYLKSLLADDNIEEADAELVLAVLGDRATDHVEHLLEFLERFPALARLVHGAADELDDVSEFAAGVLEIAKGRDPLTEDQLFWMAKIAEDYLQDWTQCADLLERLYTHEAATELTKAKVLEIPHTALNDMREEFLKGGRSDWLAWCSAMGSRDLAKSKRNHLLTYFGKASPMNAIVGDCVRLV
jgi:hypothetical protein